MVGWVFFARHDPEHYGSVGRAVLTLFLLMTLDGIGDAVHAGLEVSRWSLVYYASYVLLASFVLVNVLIGVVLTSLEEARDMEQALPAPAPDPASAPVEQRALLDRIAVVRRALGDLERELARAATPQAVEAGRTVPHLRPAGTPADGSGEAAARTGG